MDRENGGDPLAPPRPPKLLPRVHRPRAPEPSMMTAPLSPLQQRQQHHQQQQLCTNIHLHPQQNHQSINNNTINNRNSSNSSNSSSLTSSNSNNNNSNNSNSDVISIHPVPITAPLIPLQLQQQQQTFNISSNSLGSTSTNSFTRRRPPPPILINNNSALTLLPSISSNILHSQESPVSPVTLAAPRPENERLANEYVDTPFRSQQQQQPHLLHQTSRTQHPAGQTIHGQTTTPHSLLLLQQNQRRQLQQQQQQQQQQHSHPSHNQHSSNAVISGTNTSSSHSGSGGGGGTSTLLHSNISSSQHKGSSNTTTSLGTAQTTASTTTLLLPGQTPRHHLQSQQHQHTPVSRPTVLPITSAITKQPVAFSKDVPASILHDDLDMHHTGSNLGGDSPNSITCPQCKRCRCEQCQSPRKLPSRWVCNKTCLCSAEAVIDYSSCLCCVKALFYHCAKDHEMEGDDGDIISCADDPCSCLPHKRAARWGWLGALSVALPCLWCYWPMQGCVALCAQCYARHYRSGCRCQSIGSTSILSTTSTAGNTIGTAKSADGGRSGGGGGHHLNNHSNSGITGGNHHHHHHHSSGGGGGRTIIRTSDLTPEKRLLDSSPEY